MSSGRRPSFILPREKELGTSQLAQIKEKMRLVTKRKK